MGESGRSTVTVTVGEVAVSPVQYHTFRVGPFSLTLECRAGESEAEALERGQKILEKHAREAYVRARAFWANEWKDLSR